MVKVRVGQQDDINRGRSAARMPGLEPFQQEQPVGEKFGSTMRFRSWNWIRNEAWPIKSTPVPDPLARETGDLERSARGDQGLQTISRKMSVD